ncbi:MAG: DNA repair ATPase [Verrucomicrobiales bacterium]
MTDATLAEPPKPPQDQLEGGAYEIIRARMDKHGAELRRRLELLNSERQEVFGAIEAQLVATDRVTTQNNCTPRDMIAIGANRFLFGYNVQLGLKSTTDIADVFAGYEFHPDTHTFHECPFASIVSDGAFAEDFKYLYKFYRETVFVKFMVIGPNLYMAFKVGKSIDDRKTFKFLITGQGELQYLGNRFDHEYQFPPQREFEWKRAHRDMQRAGDYPHVSIEDRIFVETIGGDLTIKLEDNTASGEGIYAEPVDNVDQTLDDAEILYAFVGSLIILNIKPYQEKDARLLVYNEKTREVRRIDSIRHSCVLLPDDHGIIFSNGYYLQSGEFKLFESDLSNMFFDRRIASSNGEDFLYIFYNRISGDYILMPYNLIARSVSTPIICNGYSLFPNGELIYFRDEDQPQKHHALQVWQTPYVQENFAPDTQKDSFLYKIGNAEIVRCMAECQEVLTLLSKDDSYADLYVDLVKITSDISDAYFWTGRPETHDLKGTLTEINTAAQAAIAEFDKVQRVRKNTLTETERVRAKTTQILKTVEHTRPDDILGFVHNLAELRSVRGEIISLRDLRYIDLELVAELEKQSQDASERESNLCVDFLMRDEALDPYRQKVATQQERIPSVAKAAEATEIEKELDAAGAELEMLIDIVSNLKIEDATQTTKIIDDVSTIYSTLNQVKVELKNRKKALSRTEGAAQFTAQLKLLNQAVINYIDLCNTPDKCDEFLTKTMIQLEELEGRFSEFEEYVDQLTIKREEIYSAFESRKQSLLETRNRRAGTLAKSADRVLNGIRHRLEGFKTINDINGYLASDLMIEKVRDIIKQLEELGDSVKAGDIQTRLKTLREDAVRQLKDRQELFEDGTNVIRLGNHRFSTNTQELELSVVPRDGTMYFHLAGTNFFEKITDPEFLDTRQVWEQEVVSEDDDVYRVEFLAWRILQTLETKRDPLLAADSVQAFATLAESEQLEAIQRFMGPRYSEGYTKGVHDRDCALLLGAFLPIHLAAGLLRYSPATRACGLLFWEQWTDEKAKYTMEAKLRSFGLVRESFPAASGEHPCISELTDAILTFIKDHPRLPFSAEIVPSAARYLFDQFTSAGNPVVSLEAAEAVNHFKTALTGKRLANKFDEAWGALKSDPTGRFEIMLDWLRGFTAGESADITDDVLQEAACHLLRGGFRSGDVVEIATRAEIEGMSGSHSLTEGGTYSLHYNGFLEKMRGYDRVSVPRFEAYGRLKSALLETKRATLRLDEFKPRVMSSFVRNRLLDSVYLPMIGDNLAKQLGTAGANTRTDRMGMLLLISPPGYGKTTLMEYVANRLGITFMKINGPAIGHHVTSLDPEEAPNASAREEVNKLNLALEMGDNVMLYLDDIQHCNPEFLQKFISLCDAQRKIEGVYNGKPRTYDLRGKKVAVVMAGNPYTESGGKFQIPDMLANRADTYNLGDIIGGHEHVFKDSYIENALTSNPVLSKLASRSQKDVYAIMKIADSGSREGVDFEGNYAMEEIDELVSVVEKLMRVRDTILRVNLQYIRSAAMEDSYRTEPPFKLQGSYRNMNRIAEKILALMTDEEVERVIIDHYESESQTLTTGAEANLLKFKELEGTLNETERERWASIRETFGRNQILGGSGDNDPVSRVVGQLSLFSENLKQIGSVLSAAAAHQQTPATLADVTIEKLETIIANLRAVPVDVEIKVVPVQEGGAPRRAKKDHDLPVDIDANVQQGDA